MSRQFLLGANMNYSDLLQTKAAERGSMPFLIWDGQRISYGEMVEQSRRIGLRLGKDIGHRLVGIRSAVPIHQLAAFFAAEMAGAVPVILHEFLKGEKLRLFLEHSGLSFLLEEENGEWTVRPCGGNTMPKPVVMGVLTSGTSGMPKVLLRTYESWASFFPEQNRIFQMDDKARVYIQGSFGFTGNLSIVMGTLAAGATLVGTSALRPRTWMKDIERENVTHIYMIPSKLSALVRAEGLVSSVRMILSGSQLMTEALLRQLKTRFPRSRVLLYYGASETSYVSYLMDDELAAHPGSVGRPFPGVAVSAHEGELFVTTQGLVYGAVSPFASGDLGEIDEKGYILFHGRKSDVYNIKGNHVSKSEILSALQKMPFLQEADILPFSTEQGETKLAAFIVSDHEDREEVLSFLHARLQSWEIPAQIHFMSQLPRTSTGKTDYAALRGFIGRD